MSNENQTEHDLPTVKEHEQEYDEDSQSIQPSQRVFTPIEAGLVMVLMYTGYISTNPAMKYGSWGLAAWIYFNKRDAVALASIDIHYAERMAKSYLKSKQDTADIKPGKWSIKEGGKLELDNEGKPKWWVISCRNLDTEDMYIVRIDAYTGAVTGQRPDDGLWRPDLAPKKATFEDMFKQRMIRKDVEDAAAKLNKK